MMKELEHLYQKSKNKPGEMIERLDKYEQEVDKLERDFNLMKTLASGIQLFLGVQKFLKEVEILEKKLKTNYK